MRLRRYVFAFFAVSLVASRAFPQTTTPVWGGDGSVRINQIQVIGSHNSYHAGLLPGIARLVQQRDPKEFAGLDYAHAALDVQLSGGVRQIELDIFADSKGGRFAHPKGQNVLIQAGIPTDPDPYPEGVMLKPGFKVMHMQDLDYASNCQPFVACLQIVRTWSRTHPEHVPIFILVETKQHLPDNKNPWTAVEPFTTETLDALDAEIRSVFSEDEMITPDQVRGHHRTLEKAVRKGGWPTLAQARGKVIFLMDQTDVGPLYLEGHPALRGRMIFSNASPGQPDAAFIEKNEGDEATIASLVRQGYLVRTRADADTVEARGNDGSRRDRALRSGAQIVSTDYPQSEPAKWTGYTVALPNGLPARCNPVNGPPGCVDSLLEPTPHN
ncbi:MAG TPA: phosphatidylinositol-specific phospholipase C1-like protein [Terracidiphilus sp.]|nr:phosphatidylinositol-specific phospholipase C1-like protein [Terracidiphilus sp.]